jgi:DeoR/GlpR family transcriptional regulator of sugar metabolism
LLVRDWSKFSESAPLRVAPLEAAHQMINDGGIPSPFLKAFRSGGVALNII